jgi:hypothetical protein
MSALRTLTAPARSSVLGLYMMATRELETAWMCLEYPILNRRDAPARAMQELAGHGDLSTTQRYMHLSPAATEDAIRMLDMRLDAQSRAETGDILDARW